MNDTYQIKLTEADVKQITQFLDYGVGEIDDLLMEICEQVHKQRELNERRVK